MNSNVKKVTVITVSFNSSKTILGTLQSVAGQSYPSLEHIIIDGGSTDNTLQIIRNFCSKHVLILISEPDDGIYDAMNKGISLATGDIVAILNSDDLYQDYKVIEKVVTMFEKNRVDCVFGDLVYVDPIDTNKILRKWTASDFVPGSFKFGWHPPHPSFFVRRDVYENFGKFDVSLKVSADFEIMLRFLERCRIRSIYLPETLVKMRVGGESGKSLKNILIGNQNILKAFDKNNVPVNKVFYPFFRLVPKLIDLIKRKIF